MKHLRKLVMILCLVFVMVGGFSTTVDAAKYMDCTVTVKGYNSIKLSWKKKTVSGYKIYRARENDVDSDGMYKYKLLANVSAKKTSYTDNTVKKNKGYVYKIVGYTYKNGKYKEAYVTGFSDYEGWKGYTGLTGVTVDEYFSANTTSNEISYKIGPESDIRLFVYKNSIVPDGSEILKKINGKYVSLKKIKYKKYKKGYNFVDKQVEPGKKYSYKFRTYKKINGKMKYSSTKGTEFSVYALDETPECSVSIIKPYDSIDKNMIVSLTNNDKYGTISFSGAEIGEFIKEDKYSACSQKLEGISYDQQTWQADVKKCEIKPGETIYIKIKEETEADYKFTDIKSIAISGYFGNNFIWITYSIEDNKTDVRVDY